MTEKRLDFRGAGGVMRAREMVVPIPAGWRYEITENRAPDRAWFTAMAVNADGEATILGDNIAIRADAISACHRHLLALEN